MKILVNNNPVEISAPLNGYQLIELIDQNLVKKAVALKINDKLFDLSTTITGENEPHIEIITKNSSEALEIMRHSSAHLMAQAVQQLFDNVKVGIGPVIENGFYYDFLKEEPFSEDDLKKIDARMRELIKQNLKITRKSVSKAEALKFFSDKGESLKIELINDLEGEISTYQQGDFTDLCRGPHLPSTGFISENFKLTKIAGSYWRGDANSYKLQRIYAVSFQTKDELKKHLEFLEEAEKRDHRTLGTTLGLFHIQEEAPGSIFWHPNGYTIYLEIQNYIREKIKENGYIEVKTPQIMSRKFWEKSGHWDKYSEHMFVVHDNETVFAIKPMNCPAHVQIFKKYVTSYKDLPCRMAEFGCCHRNEPSGSMHGLMRVRGFVQDDAHIFCMKDQINSETIRFCTLLKSIYKDFGFKEIKIKFSDRPQKRAGSDEIWDFAEKALLEAAKKADLHLEYNKGEGAFYGPKLEFVLKDAIGRDWQCGTLQVDLVLPERLGATFINQNGEKEHPVMLHRAILGSMERFIGILIENYAGKFPMWLAPCQIVLANITNSTDDYVDEIYERLKLEHIRVITDKTSEKISYKIRKYMNLKTPIIGIIGDREKENHQISIRKLGSNEMKTISVDELIQEIKTQIKQKI